MTTEYDDIELHMNTGDYRTYAIMLDAGVCAFPSDSYIPLAVHVIHDNPHIPPMPHHGHVKQPVMMFGHLP